jgi:hypothetical protein
MEALERLVVHVSEQCGQRARMAGRARVHELTRLVVRHWPHNNVEAIERHGGKNNAAAAHAMLLVRAQVREQYEARHDVGPLWDLFLGGLVASICSCVLDLWLADRAWRVMLRGLSRQIAAERSADRPE